MPRIETFVNALLHKTAGSAFIFVQQITFLVVLAVPSVSLAVSAPGPSTWTLVAVGLSLPAAGVVLLLWLRSRGVPRRLEVLLPTTSIVACGICRIATYPDGAMLSTLVLVPSLWLVARFRVRGAVVATVTVIVSVTLPSLVLYVEDVTFTDVARYSGLPVTLVLICAAVLGPLQQLEASRRTAERALVREQELRQDVEKSDRRLAGVLENLNVGVLVMDAEGHDVMMNKAQREIHAIVSPDSNTDRTEAGHLIFHSDGSPVEPEARPAVRANRGEDFDRFVFLAGAPGADQRTISCSSRAVLKPDGSRESAVLIFRDVTEEHSALEIQRKVIASVSHEMRTPLTSMIGFADLADDALEDIPWSSQRGVASEHLAVIRRNGEKLERLVRDLLDEQQAALRVMTLNKEPFDIGLLVSQCLEAARPSAVRHGIQLDVESRGPCVVSADRSRITQVLDNLIENAVKYGREEGRVCVTVRQTAEGAVVEVADDGPGMTQKEASQVFVPFYRAASARRSVVGGAGLGLALVHSIVEAHGGTISVTSAPDEGTTFRVIL